MHYSSCALKVVFSCTHGGRCAIRLRTIPAQIISLTVHSIFYGKFKTYVRIAVERRHGDAEARVLPFLAVQREGVVRDRVLREVGSTEQQATKQGEWGMGDNMIPSCPLREERYLPERRAVHEDDDGWVLDDYERENTSQLTSWSTHLWCFVFRSTLVGANERSKKRELTVGKRKIVLELDS